MTKINLRPTAKKKLLYKRLKLERVQNSWKTLIERGSNLSQAQLEYFILVGKKVVLIAARYFSF